MWHNYYAPASAPEALELLGRYGESSRVIAGGTDLILEVERGVRRPETLIDVSRIGGLDKIQQRDNLLVLGPLVTHNQVAGTLLSVARAFPLARACWLVGAPQIRNRGTVAGNLITASPANDTITPLWAMDASVTLASKARGVRTLPFDEFFLGVRRTALAADEMLISIQVPFLKPSERGTFLKLGLRQAQAISLVNVAVVLEFAEEQGSRGVEEWRSRGVEERGSKGTGGAAPSTPPLVHSSAPHLLRARIALGAVAPTIVRAAEAEAYLAGKRLTDEAIERAAELAAGAARPISDVRAGAEYRRDMVRVLTARALRQVRDGAERVGWPDRPVMLWGKSNGHFPFSQKTRSFNGGNGAGAGTEAVRFTLNGQPVSLPNARGKTLLRAIREDAGLTGTKEGCAEGECGACTAWLDGIAVMSCLVPAERADGCSVTTVEGLCGPDGEGLHPAQEAFIGAAAVQCGYCTPGFLMSAASLLDEKPQPAPGQVKEAITGNLCRCTGYYKIVEAIENAATR